MRNWLIIVGREYKTRVRRSFYHFDFIGTDSDGGIHRTNCVCSIQESDSKILVIDSNRCGYQYSMNCRRLL